VLYRSSVSHNRTTAAAQNQEQETIFENWSLVFVFNLNSGENDGERFGYHFNSSLFGHLCHLFVAVEPGVAWEGCG